VLVRSSSPAGEPRTFLWAPFFDESRAARLLLQMAALEKLRRAGAAG